jgi:hypothetical protein
VNSWNVLIEKLGIGDRLISVAAVNFGCAWTVANDLLKDNELVVGIWDSRCTNLCFDNGKEIPDEYKEKGERGEGGD